MSKSGLENLGFGERFERLFASLCGQRFLKGFVFHSPKFCNPTEQEAGDIVLWIRRFVVNFELITHNDQLSNSTRQFVKRIGEKRDQLIRDYDIFRNPEIEIRLKSELGQDVLFDKMDLGGFSFHGVVLVDSKLPIDKLHFNTIKKCVESEFPLAVMTLDCFKELLTEVDTIPDLIYYLGDRSQFLKTAFQESPNLFLNLNLRTERNLISFYKLQENTFDLGEWKASDADQYPKLYQEKWRQGIELRNKENEESLVIDDIADFIRNAAADGEEGKLHTWELAMLSRRQRATELGHKVREALINLSKGKRRRWFASFNQATGCWIVFFFRYGISIEQFHKEADQITRFKLLVEIADKNYEYSVFSFCFRKSEIETGASFDNIYLGLMDACKEKQPVDQIELFEAREFFNGGKPKTIKEFPDA